MEHTLLSKLKKASKLLGTKEYFEAENIYREILARIPGFPDAYYGLYKSSYLQNQSIYKEYFSKALYNLSLTEATNETDSELFIAWNKEYIDVVGEKLFVEPLNFVQAKKVQRVEEEIDNLFKKKKVDEGKKKLKEAKRKYGLSKKLMLSYFAMLEYDKELEEATNLGYSLLKAYDDNYKVWLRVAGVFVKSSSTYSAIKSFIRAHKLKPEEYLPLYNIGVLAFESDQTTTAKTYFAKALDKKPDYIQARLSLVNCLMKQSYYDKGLKVIEDGIEFDETMYEKNILFLYSGFFKDKMTQLSDGIDLHTSYMINTALQRKDKALETLSKLKLSMVDTKTVLDKESSQESSNEKCNDIVSLLPVGRAGSLFFHSLFDGHPQVATIPGVYLKGYFSTDVWVKLYTTNKNWKNDIVERFARMYEAMFDAHNPSAVPGDPMSGKTGIGANCGLTNMGEKQDYSMLVDKVKFKEILLELLKPYKSISQREFFKLIHLAWERLKNNDDKKLIFYHIHNPNIKEYTRYLQLNPNSKNMFIVRDMVKASESWIYTLFPTDEQVISIEKVNQATREYALQQSYGKALDRLMSMFFSIVGDFIATPGTKLYAIRLEDIKNSPEPMMRKVSELLNIEFDESLLKSEFLGKMYFGPKTKLHSNMQGFDKQNIKRKNVLYDENDIEVFNTLFYPWQKKLGYTDEEFPTKQMIENAYKSNKEIMGWEKRFLEVYKVESLPSDVLAKRRRIISHILDTLDKIGDNLKTMQIIKES